jgi:hypothetical protein
MNGVDNSKQHIWIASTNAVNQHVMEKLGAERGSHRARQYVLDAGDVEHFS